MRVLAALDKFKGTATSAELGAAVVAAARACGADADAIAISDGGDGLLDVFGGPDRTTTVTGPLGQPVAAAWRLDGATAVVESAQACGLVLAGGRAGNDPMTATSAGVGELVEAAVDAGAARVLVGVGGSACTDGGLPAVDAIGDRTRSLLTTGVVDLVVCCDVTTRYLDAAERFAPQKGATADQVAVLTERLHAARAVLAERFGFDPSSLPGGGAAGGLAGGLAALGATLRSGFEVVAEATGLPYAVGDVDLVVTGEGRLDDTSFEGKVVGEIATVAARSGTDVLAIVGATTTVDVPFDVPFDVVSLTARFGPRRAHEQVLACVADVVTTYLARTSAKE